MEPAVCSGGFRLICFEADTDYLSPASHFTVLRIMMDKKNITSYQDIQSIVDEHYRQLLQDPYTSAKFHHVNLPDHMPRIYNFWSFILNIEAEEHPYKGSAFEPHTRLNLEHGHFETWLKYLFNALDTYYDGEVVELWKDKARQMGMLFEYKLGIMKD